MSSQAGQPLAGLGLSQGALIELLALVEQGRISQNVAKSVLEKMLATGQGAGQIVEAEGLAQISDESRLETVVDEVLASNPDEVQKFLAGKTSVAGFLMGQVMKATQGKANPQVVRSLIVARLEAMQAQA